MLKIEILQVSSLKPFKIREVREDVLKRLEERISERGYNQAKSLTVVKDENGYSVADGNHRLEVLKRQGIKEVPCVVYEGDCDIYNLAVEANVDEDTYAPMDLFDWLDVIGKLRNEGKTLKEIAVHLGWEEGKIKQYSVILNNIVTRVLDFAKEHQKGRVTKKVTHVTFDFTEGWFRTSGLYDLTPNYQEKLINSFIADKCNWNKSKVQSEANKYKLWQDMIEMAKEKLVSENDLEVLKQLVENNTYKSIEQLKGKINDLNKKASNKLICGDALIELENLEDNSIDLVITDPPYGIDYESNYSKYNEYVTKTPIKNDGLDEALDLIDKTCEILDRKSKKDSHFYFFTSWSKYEKFKEIISKYFSVKNCIIWDKGNASMGDLEGSWGNAYEMIIFATKGNKRIKERKHDVINVNRVPTVKAIHPTQKPEGLIKVLLDVSAQPADLVCDTFMGSGSTIKAIKQYSDNLNYIGIEMDKERFEKAKAYIGGCNNEG